MQDSVYAASRLITNIPLKVIKNFRNVFDFFVLVFNFLETPIKTIIAFKHEIILPIHRLKKCTTEIKQESI